MIRALLALAVLAAGPGVSLVGTYPNPATDEDVGEYVVLSVDGPLDLGAYAIGDGEDRVRLPNRTVDGRVAVASAPHIARSLANETTIVVARGLSLSNAGETVTLYREGRPVDSMAYPRAPTAERWTGGEWTPLGATDLPVLTVRNVSVEAFALPDAPTAVVSELATAEERILLGGYTYTSARVTEALVDARERGVRVAVLVEGSPVGGISSTQIERLDRLSAAGVEVVAIDGQRARYDFHHAKYAVVDDAVLVTSENWKPSGVGGRASRGWGTVVESPALARRLAAVFAADAGWVDGRAWSSLAVEGQPPSPANGTYPTRFRGTRSTASAVDLLVAPDNAESALTDLLAGADRSIRIQQVSIDPDGPLLARTIAAARRGVDVRVLLGGAWYVERENEALVRNLTRLADREDLPIRARVVEPRSRFDHVHVKGVIVDERTVVVGSVNWNPHSLRENREVAVAVHDGALAGYYGRIFRADWRGAAWRLTWGGVLATFVAMGVALRRASAIEFEPPGED
ncbi:MAG: phosphatidylserine/phosphatidylglycerophosphate/cardiolipin synthase family protein [Halanaeroarchaeum sp.]